MKDLEDSEEEKGKAIDFAISAVGTRLTNMHGCKQEL